VVTDVLTDRRVFIFQIKAVQEFFLVHLTLEDVSTRFLRNVGDHSPVTLNHTAVSTPTLAALCRPHAILISASHDGTHSPDQAVEVPPRGSVCNAVNRDVTSSVVAVCHVINLALRHDRRCNVLVMQHTLLGSPSGSIHFTARVYA
jgi:hypothetical protein